jgi:HSP20 family molecular chaperone IbpA
MSSFYEKLSRKIQGGDSEAAAAPKDAASAKSVTYSATGDRTTPEKKDGVPAAPPVNEVAPDGTDPLDVDLFQSESRVVIFMQVSGVGADAFEITANEESNTLTVEATQKRPAFPVAPGAKEGDPPEKGIFSKSEVKWKSLYRKIYLPMSFDGSDVQATLDKGVLIIMLPAKRPGAGKKLAVHEIQQDERKK